MRDAPLDILAFSPHPDDAEVGCGGSLLLAADKGLQVAVADLSEGEQSTRGMPTRRAQEKSKAAKLLGLSERYSIGLPDTEIGTHAAQRLPIIQLIRETRPRIVLAPYWHDRHPDHAASAKLVQEAAFYAGVSKVGSGQPHRPAHVFYYMLHHPFSPSFVVDISAVWERRMAALASYESQFKSDGMGTETAISRPDFFRALEGRAIFYGSMIGTDYGEAFIAQGPIRMSTLPGLDDGDLAQGQLPRYKMYL